MIDGGIWANNSVMNALVDALSATEHVGLAYHQNSIPFVSEIVVENPSGADAVDVVLTVTLPSADRASGDIPDRSDRCGPSASPGNAGPAP